MNTRKIATALNTLSLAFGELAEALTEQPESAASAPPSAPAEPLEILDEGDVTGLASYLEEVEAKALPPQGSEVVCPKHRKPYLEGQFGPYCSSKTNDPAWANARGYCKITPKNAAVWLRSQAA